MPALQTIYVETEFDIMFARRIIRDMARSMGFPPRDQAKVSLATSSMAHFMDMGEHRHGAISFQTYKGNGTPPHMQVVCTMDTKQLSPRAAAKSNPGPNALDPPPEALEKIKGLVDDLNIEALSPEDIQVTLTKYIRATA